MELGNRIGSLDELNQQFNIHDNLAEEYKHMEDDTSMEEQKVSKENNSSLYNIIQTDNKSYEDANMEDDKGKNKIRIMNIFIGIDLDLIKERSSKAPSEIDEDGASSTYFNSELLEENTKQKITEIIEEMCKMPAFNRYQELEQKVMKLKDEHVDIDELLSEYKNAVLVNKLSEGEMDNNENWTISFFKLVHTYYNKDYITMLDMTSKSKDNMMKTIEFLVLNYKRDGNDVQSIIYSLMYLNRYSKVYDALTLAYTMKVFYDEICIK